MPDVDFKLSPFWNVKLLVPEELSKMSGQELVSYYNLLVDYIDDLNKYMFIRKDC